MIPPPIKILLIESNVALGALLTEILQSSGLEVIGTATTADMAIHLLAHLQPDVVVLDADLSDRCGMNALALIHEIHPALPVILLNDQDERHYHQAALNRGAQACIRKDLSSTDLVPAVHQVHLNAQSVR